MYTYGETLFPFLAKCKSYNTITRYEKRRVSVQMIKKTFRKDGLRTSYDIECNLYRKDLCDPTQNQLSTTSVNTLYLKLFSVQKYFHSMIADFVNKVDQAAEIAIKESMD